MWNRRGKGGERDTWWSGVFQCQEAMGREHKNLLQKWWEGLVYQKHDPPLYFQWCKITAVKMWDVLKLKHIYNLVLFCKFLVSPLVSSVQSHMSLSPVPKFQQMETEGSSVVAGGCGWLLWRCITRMHTGCWAAVGSHRIFCLKSRLVSKSKTKSIISLPGISHSV